MYSFWGIDLLGIDEPLSAARAQQHPQVISPQPGNWEREQTFAIRLRGESKPRLASRIAEFSDSRRVACSYVMRPARGQVRHWRCGSSSKLPAAACARG